MKKRIYIYFLGLILISLLLASFLFSMFGAALPAIVAVLVFVLFITNIVAGKLTSNIIRQLDEIDFDGDSFAEYDELIPYVKKINQQKREIDKHIAALENRIGTIKVITDNMREGLLLIDRAETVLFANKSAAEIFHKYSNSMAGKNFLHICRDIEFQRGVKQCLSGNSTELTFKLDNRIYNIYFSPVYSGKEINGGAILFFDCTERHKSEQQRKEFSANVSHELKTPLTSIYALAEIIEKGIGKEDDIKGFAGKITVQAQRLISIIEDIIRLSEFDEGKVTRDFSEFNLYDLAESVIEVLREKAIEKNVTVGIDGIQTNLIANKRMIDELMYNLIDNAIKYNKDDGSVSVSIARENEFCKIIVTDTGIGIPIEHRTRIFERFYRVEGSRCKKTGGTGLGLSIAKHITEHHGGKIELNSTPKAGTTVVCWIANNFSN